VLEPDLGRSATRPLRPRFPRHRLNLALGWNSRRLLANVSASYTSEAFWVDVLGAPYHGATGAFTLVNATLGVKWGGERLVTSLKGTNLLGQEVQQHVFGDVIGRVVVFEARLRL
jgi:hypothetical protein